jgi:2-dehydropantoate 2-reductase
MPDDDRERIISYWRTFPSETRSSMANDLAQGRRMELAWLSGRMHTLGEKFGVATPAHSAVYRALHLYADGDKPSG